MEKRLKERRLSVLFIGTLAAYAVSTFVLCCALLVALLALANAGLLLPANVQEIALSERIEDIRAAAPKVVGAMIPDGATYGIYDKNGEWLMGTLAEERRSDAWARYEMRTTTPDDDAFYKYIPMNDGNVCIARYYLGMCYADDALNGKLPPPEHLLAFFMVVAALGNLLYCAHRFARTINRRLEALQQVTAKIAANDLDFEVVANTGIREINEVMGSLDTLKGALKTSLTTQWQQEQQKQEQLAALAHDIKTPLTVIRGNAELLQETAEDKSSRICANYIVNGAEDIATYLEQMRAVMNGATAAPCEERHSSATVVEWLRHAARQLTAAAQMPLTEHAGKLDGTLCCREEDVLRAWRNILSNAVGYTDQAQGIECRYDCRTQDGSTYLVATVCDHGPGFSARDLAHAKDMFYQGDQSRHDRNHQGLGLAIAEKIVQAQNGKMTLANTTTGAEVSLWLKLEQTTAPQG